MILEELRARVRLEAWLSWSWQLWETAMNSPLYFFLSVLVARWTGHGLWVGMDSLWEKWETLESDEASAWSCIMWVQHSETVEATPRAVRFFAAEPLHVFAYLSIILLFILLFISIHFHHSFLFISLRWEAAKSSEITPLMWAEAFGILSRISEPTESTWIYNITYTVLLHILLLYSTISFYQPWVDLSVVMPKSCPFKESLSS